jgi:superfamily I DNA/RNA helicase
LNIELNSDKIKVLTVHSAKGLEFDAVVAIGCNQMNSEECHISYVAATRARDILIWLSQSKELKKFENKRKNF